MYYENFEKLCLEKNVTASKVSKNTGISTATLSSWKNGTYTPKQDKLQLIADYFDVTLDYLVTGENTKSIKETAEIDIALTNISNKIKEYALKLAELPNDRQELIMNLIDALNKGGKEL